LLKGRKKGERLMGKSLIQQQIVTKDSKGLFLTGDGFDTIAVSPNVNERFVKKYLNPINTYHIPSDLKKSGEKEIAAYPPLFTFIQPETGELVLGKANFAPAESAKQKNRLFVHNYIIPAIRKEEWIHHSSKIFHIEHFYGLEDTEHLKEELEEIEHLAYTKENIFAKKQELFHVLQLDEKKFKELLFACITAVAENKRVYISFQASHDMQHKYAMWLLELLFLYMPYETRRLFGATTFHNEPEIMENIHVMFVEQGSIRLRNKAVENQFTFDLSQDKINGLNFKEEEHDYLHFAYEALVTATELDEFFIYCERALKGLDKQTKLTIQTYNSLFLLFYMEKLDYYFYDNDKVATLEMLLVFLQKKHREKLELVHIFKQVLHREELMKDASIVQDYLKLVLEIQKVVEHVDVVEFIVKTIAYYEGEAVCQSLWEILEKYPDTYQQVLSYMSDIFSYAEIIEDYLKHQFSFQHSLSKVLINIKNLLQINSSFEHNGTFLKSTKNRLVYEVKKNSHPISIVFEIVTYFQRSLPFESYKRMVLPDVKGQLLVQLQLEKVNLADVKHFGEIFLLEKEERSFEIKGWEKEKFEVLELLYTYFYLAFEQTQYVFRMASAPITAKACELAQDIIKENGLFKPYERFLLLFPGGMEGVEHRQVFSYIAIYGSEDEMLDYIEWSLKKFGTSPRFSHALKNYLITDRNSIWKKKEMKRELASIRSQSLKKLLKEVREQTANPGVKFFRKHGVLLIVVVILGVVAYFYTTFNGQ